MSILAGLPIDSPTVAHYRWGAVYPLAEFRVESDGTVTLVAWDVPGVPAPTIADIVAARADALAAKAAKAALLDELKTDKATLAAAFTAMHDRLVQIESAATPTNAQVIQAVRDLATYQKRILRVMRVLLNGT